VDQERQMLHVMDEKQRVALAETLNVDGGAAVATPAARLRYQLVNHLSSACVEVDESGQIIAYEEYSPFGTTAFRSARGALEVGGKRYRYMKLAFLFASAMLVVAACRGTVQDLGGDSSGANGPLDTFTHNCFAACDQPTFNCQFECEVAGTCPVEELRHGQLLFVSSTANGCVWSFSTGFIGNGAPDQLTMDCTSPDAGERPGCMIDNGVCDDLAVEVIVSRASTILAWTIARHDIRHPRHGNVFDASTRGVTNTVGGTEKAMGVTETTISVTVSASLAPTGRAAEGLRRRPAK
jgi:hypothetical protein